MVRGFVWCFWSVGVGLALALLGAALDWPRLMAIGAGLVAAVVVGWPVLLLAGALHGAGHSARRR